MAIFSTNNRNHLKITSHFDDEVKLPYTHLYLPKKDLYQAVKRHKPKYLSQSKDFDPMTQYMKSGKIYLSRQKDIRTNQLKAIDKCFDNPQFKGFWVDQTSFIDLGDTVTVPTQSLIEQNSSLIIHTDSNKNIPNQCDLKLMHLFKTNIDIESPNCNVEIINTNMYDTNLSIYNFATLENISTQPAKNPKTKERTPLDITVSNVKLTGPIVNLYAANYKTPIKNIIIENTDMGGVGLQALTSTRGNCEFVRQYLNPDGRNAENIYIQEGYFENFPVPNEPENEKNLSTEKQTETKASEPTTEPELD